MIDFLPRHSLFNEDTPNHYLSIRNIFYRSLFCSRQNCCHKSLARPPRLKQPVTPFLKLLFCFCQLGSTSKQVFSGNLTNIRNKDEVPLLSVCFFKTSNMKAKASLIKHHSKDLTTFPVRLLRFGSHCEGDSFRQ